jgi:hypothetical protein
MKRSAIRLQSDWIPDGTPLVADILDADLNLKWRGTVIVNDRVVLPELLDQGRYAVVIALPSGQTVPVSVTVRGTAERELVVRLPVKPAPSALAPSYFPGTFPPVASSAPALVSYGSLGTTWARLWSRDAAGAWRVQPWTASLQAAGQDVVGELAADQLPLGQHCIQIGGGSSQPRVTAIPPGKTSFVLRPTRRSDVDDPRELAIDIEVCPANPEAQVLLGYLSTGDLERARLAGRAVAARLGDDPARDPIMAVPGAYFLLVCRDLVRLGQVIDRHLAQWEGWLPDVAVLDAWRLLRQAPPNIKSARDRLLEAAMRGVPLFTRGLRLLLDGLYMMAADETWRDDAVAHALESVRQFAQVTDWSPPFTTYFAVRPDAPIHPRDGIGWLAQAQEAARDPYSEFPWAGALATGHAGQALRKEMESQLSAPFSRAFGYPPAYADLDAGKKNYEEFQKSVSNLGEAGS